MQVTRGTRLAVQKFLEVIESEMKIWMRVGACPSEKTDDVAVLNYLYYSGQLPFASVTTFPRAA